MVPDVTAWLHHCKKGGGKLKWKQERFSLQRSGIYAGTKVPMIVCS